MPSLLEMLAASHGGPNDAQSVNIPDEVAARALLDLADRAMVESCPFAPRDLVTMRRGFTRGRDFLAGKPCVVLHVMSNDEAGEGDHVPGFSVSLAYHDEDGDIATAKVSFWALERYVGPVVSLEDEAA